jgi:hypothetical protein
MDTMFTSMAGIVMDALGKATAPITDPSPKRIAKALLTQTGCETAKDIVALAAARHSRSRRSDQAGPRKP